MQTKIEIFVETSGARDLFRFTTYKPVRVRPTKGSA